MNDKKPFGHMEPFTAVFDKGRKIIWSMILLWIFAALVNFTILGLVIWAIVHFVHKYW